MKKGLTEVVFIIDKSIAMCGLEDDVVREFNTILEEQRDVEGEALVTTALFDDRYELFHDRTDIRAAVPLSREEYTAKGKTAMLDAIGRAMHKFRRVRYGTKEEFRAEKVIFVIITGSRENASQGYTEEMIRQRIEYRKKKYGWKFAFFGANMDAAAEAGKIGISADWVQSYRADSAGLRAVYTAVSAMLATFRKGTIRSCEEGSGVRSADGDAAQHAAKVAADIMFAQKYFLQGGCQPQETLRTQLGHDIVFTGMRAEATGERKIEEEELLEGEICATVFTVGCYAVRIAKCLYVDDARRGVHYTERVPAEPDRTAEYRDAMRSGQAHEGKRLEEGCLYDREARMVTEVSARYDPGRGDSADGWRNICTAATSCGTWSESIVYICTVKRNHLIPDEQAALFVSKRFMGSSQAVDYWYKFMPDGDIELYSIGGYGQSNTKAWEL